MKRGRKRNRSLKGGKKRWKIRRENGLVVLDEGRKREKEKRGRNV